MKKIPVVFFLGILLLQVAGCYMYFVVRLSGIRSEMREQLKQTPIEKLTLLTLTVDQFKKSTVDDHEVKVGGKMYDIARIVEQDDKVLVYALHDEAEDNLLSFLNEMVERSSKDKKPVPTQLIQLLTLQFVTTEEVYHIPAGLWIKHHTAFIVFFPVADNSILSPPPRG